jgi:hypothetical protein
MDYSKQLAMEVVAVGAMVVVVNNAINMVAPKNPPYINLFLTGAVIHLGCEASGINKWYLTHSAASIR